jgi:hypothetical protein
MRYFLHLLLLLTNGARYFATLHSLHGSTAAPVDLSTDLSSPLFRSEQQSLVEAYLRFYLIIIDGYSVFQCQLGGPANPSRCSVIQLIQ